MKELYTELQEEGWKREEIEKIPDKLAWEMVASEKVKEIVKKLKNRLTPNLPLNQRKNV